MITLRPSLARRTNALSRRMVTVFPILAVALLGTVTSVEAKSTAPLTSRPGPAWSTLAGSIDRITDGTILTVTHLHAVLAIAAGGTD